jgi:hypothetical protein
MWHWVIMGRFLVIEISRVTVTVTVTTHENNP